MVEVSGANDEPSEASNAAPKARESEAWLEPSRRVAPRAAWILVAAVFLTDLFVGPKIAAGALYIVPLLISLWRSDARLTNRLAIACSALVVVALIAGWWSGSVSGSGLSIVISHALAIFAIWVTANLGTMRLAIEADLIENREITRTTLRSLSDAVITTDRSGQITYLNRAAQRMTGWSRQEGRGLDLGEVFRRVSTQGDDGAGIPRPELLDVPNALRKGRATLLARNGCEIPIQESRTDIVDEKGRVRGEVIVFRDETERQRYEKEIRKQAYRDGLTGLANRTSMLDRLQLELAHAKRQRSGLALLYLDLDGFKKVNDQFGHAAGDAVLKSVAGRLVACLREGDTVARLGGDEFTVILPGARGSEDAAQVAEKIVAALAQPVDFEGRKIRVGVSIGIVLHPGDGSTSRELLRRADEAMYGAKEEGGLRYAFRDAATERNVS